MEDDMEKDSVKNNELFFQVCELTAWLTLIRDRRWSRRQKHELISQFGAPQAIYKAPVESLKNIISGRIRAEVATFNVESLMTQVEKDLSWIKANNASLITYTHLNYPALLKQIDDPPLALFGLGDISLLCEPQVSIVGSRRPTPIGAKVARQIAGELSNLGIVITSGMALGIDGLAHQGALEQGNATVAVMGCGLDVIYPARHKQMFEQIQSSGLLVSEYPLGVKPSRYTFPERNRIVSGLSMGTVIVEAAKKSGTLITARLAMEQNREVMVLPGSAVSYQYEGSHQLIKNGAALLTSTDDVLFILKDQLDRVDVNRVYSNAINDDGNNSSNSNYQCVNVEEDSFLALIGAESISIESLILSSGLTPAEVSSMLLILELEGRIAMSDNGGYINVG